MLVDIQNLMEIIRASFGGSIFLLILRAKFNDAVNEDIFCDTLRC